MEGNQRAERLRKGLMSTQSGERWSDGGADAGGFRALTRLEGTARGDNSEYIRCMTLVSEH